MRIVPYRLERHQELPFRLMEDGRWWEEQAADENSAGDSLDME
jgi:hypothetical protein